MDTIDLQNIHAKCGEIFRSELLKEPEGNSCACDIWDVMTEGHDNCDNCIGENFNQLTLLLIDNWFEAYNAENVKREFYVYTYMFWLYLFIERIEFILKEIDPKRDFRPIKEFQQSLKTSNCLKTHRLLWIT